MSDLEEVQRKAREIREIALSPSFGVFKEKLLNDYIQEVNNLIAGESVETRAKIKYITEIIGWFDINMTKDQDIEEMKKKNLTDDY